MDYDTHYLEYLKYKNKYNIYKFIINYFTKN